jgi:hypothetical protein
MLGGAKRKLSLALLVAAVAAAAVIVPLASASANTAKPASKKPAIRTEEVGYFGTALTTNSVSVFAYSNLGPKAGNRVTVCIKGGSCKRAQGHNAHLAWYSAGFTLSKTLRMGDPVTFTVTMSDGAGRSKVTVTKNLLCMHNNGSTPQT